MTQPTNRSDDAFLQAALRALPPDVDPAALDALKQRALADWSSRAETRSARQPEPASAIALEVPDAAWAGPDPGRSGDEPGSAGEPGRTGGGRLRWMTAAALVVALVAAYAWSQRPDPMMEELMRLDVLSQMTAGQM